MGERQVWVTGLGVMSSLGIGVEDTWQGLVSGKTGVALAEASDAATAVECPVSALVPKFRASKMVKNRKSLKIMTRPVRLGVIAAGLAWDDAGLVEGEVDPERLGVFVGAGQAFADRTELEGALDLCRDGESGGLDMVRYGQQGIDRIHPLWLLRGLSNNVLGFVSLDYNAQGINNNYANSGVSSTQAISMGALAIEDGFADVVFAGGYDSIVGPECMMGYGRLGLLSSQSESPELAHRPFDRHRTGLVPSEGSCFLILEAAEHAKARGKAPLAVLSGGGVAMDAFGVADPDPAGTKMILAAREALRLAGLESSDIGAIFAHGAASSRYDAIEIAAYRSIFGQEHLSKLPLTADKAGLGHTVAACGAMSAAMAARAIHHGVIPPIASLSEPDAACQGPDFVTGEARPCDAKHVLVASAGLGGQAGALILSKP